MPNLNTKYQIPNNKCQIPNIKYQTPDTIQHKSPPRTKFENVSFTFLNLCKQAAMEISAQW